VGKILYNAAEVFLTPKFVALEPPQIVKPVVEEEYKGPTREEIEAENKRLIEEAQKQSEEIIENAKKEAEKIIKEAEDGAFAYIKKATEKAKKIEEEAYDKANKIVFEKEKEINQKIEEQRKAFEQEIEQLKQNAYKEGYEAGYNSGKAEVERLIKRLHVIIEGAIDKRDKIIADAEEQIIRIILLITRKVVKAISEEQKNVIIENIKAALDKIKGKTEVVIRVNTEDLEMATEHKDEIMQMFEELKHVTILEDTRVDRGGCIIETDFGSVDARIATQLQEIEDKIRELANISYFKVSQEVKTPEKTPEPAKKSTEPG
jgi:flagellar assembly protein FliH